MAKTKKYYVVWEGRERGVFSSWADCKARVDSFAGAKYKSYPSQSEAEAAFRKGYAAYKTSAPKPKEIMQGNPLAGSIRKESWSVDAACSGNPGLMEYQGVHTDTGEQIFHFGPFPDATNNIGEFLALVHAMALMRKQGIILPIYSDSRTAMSWVAKKLARTNLKPTARNAKIFELIERAEHWLRQNPYDDFLILKWETKVWGEIPADFGRK